MFLKIGSGSSPKPDWIRNTACNVRFGSLEERLLQAADLLHLPSTLPDL
jgi:hypothetical protein